MLNLLNLVKQILESAETAVRKMDEAIRQKQK